MAAMLLNDLVETSGAVAATRSRKAKIAAIAERLRLAGVDELPIVTAYVAGTILQRRTGVGWRGLSALPEPAGEPSITVLEVHDALGRLATTSGPGSADLRAAGVHELFARLTADEQHWLRGVMTGNVRQGALDSLVQEAIASAWGVKLTAVRRAAMLAGGTVPIVLAAMTGGEGALAEIGLEVGRPVLPMLASTAPDVAAAMAKAGGGAGGGKGGGGPRHPGRGRHQARRNPDPGAPAR
jgi:DNA ligase 1